MNKKIFMLFAMLLIIRLFSLPSAFADGVESKQQSTFVLPLSLQEIEEGAFSGTAVQNVIFPDGFIYVGEDAFSGAEKLVDVYIPKSTKYIADSAFSITPKLVIHGVKGSYAEDWAKEHNVPFEKANIWRYILHQGQSIHGSELKADILLWTIDPFEPDKTETDTQDDNKSYRVEDRPEFHPIDYRFP